MLCGSDLTSVLLQLLSISPAINRLISPEKRHLNLQGTCSHSLSDPEASLAVAGLVFVIALFLFCFCYLLNLILFGKLVLCP